MMNRNRILRSSLWMVAVALLAAGCTSSTATGPNGPGGKTPIAKQPTGPAKDPEPVNISNRAKLLFEDAVKAMDAQKKGKAVDYPSLERKFKAAMDADPNLAEADYNLGVTRRAPGQEGRGEELVPLGAQEEALAAPGLREPGRHGAERRRHRRRGGALPGRAQALPGRRGQPRPPGGDLPADGGLRSRPGVLPRRAHA